METSTVIGVRNAWKREGRSAGYLLWSRPLMIVLRGGIRHDRPFGLGSGDKPAGL
ncbi:MAG TPA: hypothetical protein VF960_00170 [Chloroflexota bacterium]